MLYFEKDVTMRKPLLCLLPLTLAAVVHNAHAQSLPEAIQQALQAHPQVQAGINGRLAADYQLKAARGGYLPSIDVFAGYGREGTDDPTTRAARDSHWTTLTRGESSLRIQQMLFDGFATSSEVGRQEATVNARAYGLLATSERTALEAVEVYLDVLRREELVQLAEDNLKSHERIFDQIYLRSRRGVGSSADSDQAEARLAQARNNLLTEQTNLADAQVNFLSVVGHAPQGLSKPVGVLAQLPGNRDEARQRLIENNPQLRSAEADVLAAERQYEAAKAAFYPRLDAELSRGADNNIDGLRGHTNEWQAMLRMRYNLLAGGSNRAQLEARSYEVNQARDIRNNALRVLTEDLGLAWNALENAREQKAIAANYVRSSVRVREAYQKQFSLGDRTLLDLLDNENELFAAQRRLVDVTYAELYSQYRIKAATGELMKSQGVVAPLEALAVHDDGRQLPRLQ